MFTVVKNTLKCNKTCWFCSDAGEQTMSTDDIIKIYKKEDPDAMLLIGGEPMVLGIKYYLDILNAGVRFAMQSNFTLYDEEWNQVFKHPNFDGLSVSGDKMPEKEFLEKMGLLKSTTNLNPIVLLIAFDLETVKHWYQLSLKHKFDVKFNYIAPIGKLKNEQVDIKPYYKIMTEFMDTWDTNHKVEPVYSLVHEDNYCPYINCITKTPEIYSIEPDGEKFFCCVLGSLRAQKEDLLDGSMIPMDCLACEDFTQCRGCIMRNSMVAGDAEYCGVMKAFFNKIREKRNAR